MSLIGLQPLLQHLESPDVLEVMVVNGSDVWVESAHGINRAGTLTQEEISLITEGISRMSSRRIDALSPILDARLPDGSRACVVMPPIAIHGTSINIRKFPARPLPVAAFGSHTMCEQIRELVVNRANVVVSGATSTGKTSLVSAASEWFLPQDRVVCVEDTTEIRCRYSHVVHLQTRPANQDGVGELTLHHLVTTALRMRPDRLLVGEVRGGETLDMLLALSAGHSGSWSTVHALSAHDTISRLSTLVVRHHRRWTHEEAEKLVRSSVDAIVHIQRLHTGQRIISDIVNVKNNLL